jgi:hypothetical protein
MMTSRSCSKAKGRGADLNHMPDAREKRNRLSASTYRALPASLAATLIVFAIQPSKAVEPGLVKIAVFDFELNDKSAGGGIIGQDAIDTENLKLSTEEARGMLSASGRYNIVDASSATGEVISAGGLSTLQRMRRPVGQEAWRGSVDGRSLHESEPDGIHPSDPRQGHPDGRNRV